MSRPRPTVEEASRISRMLDLGCIVCRHFGQRSVPECHHLTDGGRRIGHWYTLPLCPGHHRGVWPREISGVCDKDPGHSIADGQKLFTRTYGSQRLLWQEVQHFLGLDADWPQSKIVQRRIA